MWLPRAENAVEKKSGGNGLIAVAIDKDKGSQHALKWATEKLLYRGQTLILIHVVHRSSSLGANLHSATSEVNGIVSPHRQNLEKQTKELFLTFRCFCTFKDIHCHDVILEGTDIAKTIAEYVSCAAIDILVLGATSRHGFIKRFKITDIPSQVLKAAPDFCTIYVISKTKISSVRNASRPPPFNSPLHNQLQRSATSSVDSHSHSPSKHSYSLKAPLPADRSAPRSYNKGREVHLQDDTESIRSPFNRGGASQAKLYREFSSEADTDISFVSSGRPSTDGRVSVSIYDTTDSAPTSRVSASSEGHSFGSMRLGSKWNEDFSASSLDSGRTSCSSQGTEEVEAEMRRLKLELKQTMEMYSTACKEALSAKQKALELHRWRVEEERRLEEAHFAEESAMAMAETERAKCRVAMESAEAAQRIADMESQRRRNAELKYYEEEDEKVNEVEDKRSYQLRYRKYTIEEIEEATEYFSESRKIGEGGYGPVYRCDLDHTRVAVKVLRPDAAHGREQFQQEVEVLSCMRHPNMVLLLGACPEYGCLVYEYMASGSLEDRLFRRGNSRPLPWQLRFRIAAEIATGLLFLHQTKPEPLVHRDLKPGNILLDRNFVSKISDVGLARLVPPSVADDVTQYRMTSTAGTFCYIDPEYQQTGMLGVKSDVYSLGIVLLQLITAKPAMGLAHHVGKAIEKGTFPEMLDPAVPDWPVEEALSYARVAVQCAELRRKDRPDLGKVVLPELNRLRDLADDMMMDHFFLGGSTGYPSRYSSPHSHSSMSQQNSQSQSQGVISETHSGRGN